MSRQLSCLNRQQWLHLLVLVLLLKGIDGGISDIKSQCSGYNVCLEYDVSKERYSSVYWYEKASNKCLLLGRRCVKPNRNNTFTNLLSCQEICRNEANHNKVAPECGKGKECQQDIPPNSNTTTKPSLSPIIAVVCAIGGIALVAIVVAGAFMVKRRKKIQKRRYVEDMLHMWSSNSDDSYDSYDDNPEDNNLFDRLERNW